MIATRKKNGISNCWRKSSPKAFLNAWVVQGKGDFDWGGKSEGGYKVMSRNMWWEKRLRGICQEKTHVRKKVALGGEKNIKAEIQKR